MNIAKMSFDPASATQYYQAVLPSGDHVRFGISEEAIEDKGESRCFQVAERKLSAGERDFKIRNDDFGLRT